uniref:DUF7789 domain-containing protein n=1 Tax=Plectus sambesii TaxID=2011161 RepID=A0A914V8M6_9BILA
MGEPYTDDTSQLIRPPPPQVIHDVLGYERRTWRSLRRLDWTFMAISTVSMGAVAGLTITRMVQYAPALKLFVPGASEYANRTSTQSIDFAFALLLLVNTVFCIYYVYSGLLRERLFEMYMYIGGVAVVVLYCVSEWFINESRRSTIKDVRLGVAVVLGPVNIILAVLVVRSFGWLEFRIVGASETLQKIYRQRSFYFSFLAFDLQAAASFIALAMTDGQELFMWKIILTAVGIPLSVIYTLIGSIAVKRELKWLCALFATLSILVPAYVIFHTIRLFLEDSSGTTFLISSTCFAGILLILVRFIMLIQLLIAAKNFGRGMRSEVLNFDAVAGEIHELRDLCFGCCR